MSEESTARSRVEARRQETRNRLLEAGRDILTDEPSGGIASHVKSTEVTRRANLSAGSLYYHWLSHEDYTLDLTDFVLSSIGENRSEQAGPAQELFRRRLGSEGRRSKSQEPVRTPDEAHRLLRENFREAVREAGNHQFKELMDDRSVYVQMALWADQDQDAAIGDRLREMYEGVEEAWRPVFEGGLETLGRRMRPPFTTRMLMTTLIAVAEGLVLRGKVDAEAVRADEGWSLLSRIAFSLCWGLTVEATDEAEESTQETTEGSAEVE